MAGGDQPSARGPEGHHSRATRSDDLITRGGQVDREALYALYAQQEGDDEQPICVRFKLARELNKRLDRYLVERIPFLSRTSLKRLIQEQGVTVNGRVGKPALRLHAGDEITAILPPPASTEIPAEEIPLEILYEDDDVVVINKSGDIMVHPARGNQSGTIINGLAWHFQHKTRGKLSAVGEDLARPGVVHRLDRHTTGLLVFAKTEVAHWRIARQFEKRTTEKRYLAVVHGRVEPLADVIDAPLGKHPILKRKYAVRFDATGKPSVTIYRVRERYERFTLLEVELKTGRTHQIRVHLAYLGYPIAGDDMYGGRHLTVADVTGPAGTAERSPRDRLLSRQALHATVLGFVHPTTKTPMTFQAPLPADLRDLVELLRRHQLVDAPRVAGATIDLDAMMSAA